MRVRDCSGCGLLVRRKGGGWAAERSAAGGRLGVIGLFGRVGFIEKGGGWAPERSGAHAQRPRRVTPAV